MHAPPTRRARKVARPASVGNWWAGPAGPLGDRRLPSVALAIATLLSGKIMVVSPMNKPEKDKLAERCHAGRRYDRIAASKKQIFFLKIFRQTRVEPDCARICRRGKIADAALK